MKTTIDTLKAENRNLVDQLRTSRDVKSILPKIKANDVKISKLKREEMINNHNLKQSKIRDLALIAWNCEQTEEDIFTNDGSPHKTKVKKYPNLAAVDYLRGTFKNGQITGLRVNGHLFKLGTTSYEYGKPEVFTRFESLDEFLDFNSVQKQDLCIDEFNTICNKLGESENKLKDAIQAYEQTRKDLGINSLSYWGLMRQNDERLYTYQPNN